MIDDSDDDDYFVDETYDADLENVLTQRVQPLLHHSERAQYNQRTDLEDKLRELTIQN